jgi:hypothetical protein
MRASADNGNISERNDPRVNCPPDVLLGANDPV